MRTHLTFATGVHVGAPTAAAAAAAAAAASVRRRPPTREVAQRPRGAPAARSARAGGACACACVAAGSGAHGEQAPAEGTPAPASGAKAEAERRESVGLRAGADPNCTQCKGNGEIECPVCDSKGFVSLEMMNTVSATQCRLCQGRRIVPCPTCRTVIYESIVWWDRIPSEEEDPEQSWQEGPDGDPRMPWTPPPV
jgi:hypothetical protein